MSYIRILNSVLKPALFETHLGNLIEFYSDSGELTALLFKQFNSDLYMLVTRADPDWAATLIRLGYTSVNHSPQDFLQQVRK